ncbi:MAG: hypothetical protein GX046_04310 [Tissierellia bacterium]|nr:hypothetical protein [Tissierellia bacterium]
MKMFRVSGFGCLIFMIVLFFLFSVVLRLTGFVISGFLSNPLLFFVLAFIVYLGRHKIFKEEKPIKSNEVEYEFIDEEEDPEN